MILNHEGNIGLYWKGNKNQNNFIVMVVGGLFCLFFFHFKNMVLNAFIFLYTHHNHPSP